MLHLHQDHGRNLFWCLPRPIAPVSGCVTTPEESITYKGLLRAFTLDLDDRLSLAIFNSERPMLLTPTNLWFGQVPPDKPFNVEDGITGIDVKRLFRRFSNSFMSETPSRAARDE
jgi:hypothetical protein